MDIAATQPAATGENANIGTNAEGAAKATQAVGHTAETTRVPARIALVGVHGFGAHHLMNLERLRELGLVDLVAVADPNPPAPGTLPEGTAVHGDLQALLGGGHNPDIIIVATPIQTHAPLALAALAAHADLYLEKPPVASMADFRRLQEASAASGRSVQIGFQSLGSHALAGIEELLLDGTIGSLQGIGATGRWVRDKAYYKRSRWAGKRSLDGVDVVDGVATNPLAHAIATALRIAGARTAQDLASVETDLYRANDIEADDTSVIKIRTVQGLPVTCALTLCATESVEPYITLQGTEGTAVFYYTQDRLVISNAAGERTETFGRDDLTENLLAHLNDGTPLISPLDASGAFMRVLEAIRTADSPALIDAAYVSWEGEGEQAHAVVRGIEDALERSVRAHATFRELGLPWARPVPPDVAKPLLFDDGGRPLAVERTGKGLTSGLSPRPYLHPVTTLAGIIVTDHLPVDHPWHLGVGFALQDVNGNNFWGGRTYTRDAGAYVARPDHGHIDVVPSTSGGAAANASELLAWHGADGQALLRELRTAARTILDDHTWRLDVSTELTAVVDVSLGSPGSNGARGSGYGGFFWRLPACSEARVFTPDAEGEPNVHGSVAPWIAWTAKFGNGNFDKGNVRSVNFGTGESQAVATLAFAAPVESPDPWFVRSAEYPAVGSALAWDSPVTLAAGESLRRSISVWLCDGELSATDIDVLVARSGEL